MEVYYTTANAIPKSLLAAEAEKVGLTLLLLHAGMPPLTPLSARITEHLGRKSQVKILVERLKLGLELGAKGAKGALLPTATVEGRDGNTWAAASAAAKALAFLTAAQAVNAELPDDFVPASGPDGALF